MGESSQVLNNSLELWEKAREKREGLWEKERERGCLRSVKVEQVKDRVRTRLTRTTLPRLLHGFMRVWEFLCNLEIGMG